MQLHLIVAAVLLATVGAALGNSNVIVPQDGVMLSVSAPASTDTNFFRIAAPAAISTLSVTVSTSGASTVTIDVSQGYLPNVQFFGNVPGSLTRNINPGAAATFQLYNNPSQSIDWFVLITVPTAEYPINVTFTTSATQDSAYRTLIPDNGPLVFNVDGTLNANSRTPLAKFTARTRYDMFYSIPLTPITPGSVRFDLYDAPVGINGAFVSSTFLPGETRYVDLVPLISTTFSNQSFVLALASTPREFSRNNNMLNLVAFSPVQGYINLADYLASSYTNMIKITVSFDSIQANDTVLVKFGRKRWPVASNLATAIPASTGSFTYELTSCDIDWTNKVSLLSVVFIPGIINPADIESHTSTMSVNVAVSISAAPATMLNPSEPAESYPLLSVANAVSNAANANVYSFFRSGNTGSGGDVVSAPNNMVSGWTSSQGCYAVRSTTAVISNYNPTPRYPACAFAAGSNKNLNILQDLAIVSRSNLTYTTSAPLSIPTDSSVAEFAVSGTLTLAKAAADPALYPMIVKVLPVTIANGITASVDQFFYGRNQCGNGNNPPNILQTTQRCTFQAGAVNPCYIVLQCASEALVFNGGISGTSNFNVSVISTGAPVYTFDMATSESSYVVPLDGLVGVQINVPSGVTLTATISANVTVSTKDVNWASFGCNSNEVVIPLQLSRLTASSFDFPVPSSGLLTLRNNIPSTSDANFTVTIQATTTCSSDLTQLPSMCSGLLTGSIDVLNYNKAAAEANLAIETEEFAAIASVSTGSACYSAFVRQACMQEVPMCNNAPNPCAEDCNSKLTAAGCPSRWSSFICSNFGGCTLPVVPPSAPVADPTPVEPQTTAPGGGNAGNAPSTGTNNGGNNASTSGASQVVMSGALVLLVTLLCAIVF